MKQELIKKNSRKELKTPRFDKVEFTEDQIEELRKLAPYLTTEQLGHYFGISKRTFLRVSERDERVKRAYNAGRAECIKNVASTLIQQALAGNTAAAIFYLKTQAKWRENSTEDTDSQVTIVIDSTDAKL